MLYLKVHSLYIQSHVFLMDFSDGSGSVGALTLTIVVALWTTAATSLGGLSTVNFLKTLPAGPPLDPWPLLLLLLLLLLLVVPVGWPATEPEGERIWVPPRLAISSAVGGPASLLRRKTKDHLSKFAVERRALSSTSFPVVPR